MVVTKSEPSLKGSISVCVCLLRVETDQILTGICWLDDMSPSLPMYREQSVSFRSKAQVRTLSTRSYVLKKGTELAVLLPQRRQSATIERQKIEGRFDLHHSRTVRGLNTHPTGNMVVFGVVVRTRRHDLGAACHRNLQETGFVGQTYFGSSNCYSNSGVTTLNWALLVPKVYITSPCHVYSRCMYCPADGHVYHVCSSAYCVLKQCGKYNATHKV